MIPDVSPLLSVLFLAAVVAGVYMLLLAAGWLVAWHREHERLRVDREWAEIQRARDALKRIAAYDVKLDEATRARHLARIRAEAHRVDGLCTDGRHTPGSDGFCRQPGCEGRVVA